MRRQYSGNAHGVLKGIGVVNLVYYNAHIEQYWVLDFRVFDPERDGKSNLAHVNDMLDSVAFRGIVYQTQQTVYQIKKGLLLDYLRQQLHCPTLAYT